jgi:two-component system, chemotaxis family, protein-glutamate methylesterase/glutaminase
VKPHLFIYQAIVIGASAGGLQAITYLLVSLPADYPIPVIVVQHRTRDPKDLLEEVLQHKCTITIKQADEKEMIEGGYVYITPPGYYLMIENDRTFSLSSDDDLLRSTPSITGSFESAAQVYKDKLVGIILTGANDDGSDGIRLIKEHGGLIIAQDPKEALAPYMPRAAIATGAVQFSWRLEQISKFLIQIGVPK